MGVFQRSVSNGVGQCRVDVIGCTPTSIEVQREADGLTWAATFRHSQMSWRVGDGGRIHQKNRDDSGCGIWWVWV